MRLLVLFLLGILCSSHAYGHVFHVGEDDGWTLKPSENYTHWAQRNRFQINDQLFFKYKKGEDSVLVVREEDYNKCNKKNPIQTLNDGDSKFKFHRSGPFFFISGHDQNCENGQKLVVVVIADRHRCQPPSSVPAPSHAPPSSHSPSPSPSPSPTARTPSHAPPVHPPSHPPSQAPSPSPVAKTPAHAPPTHSPSPSATKPPTHAPTAQPPSDSPSPSSKPTPPPSPTQAPPANPPSPPPSPVSPPPNPAAPQPDPDSQDYPPVYLPPHLAPAPAPSSAPSSVASFIFTTALAFVATAITAGIIV